MRNISWDSNSYYIDGKPAFLVSGEFHYFRVPKSDWRRRLELFKEAGGNCVATYIPWLIHEPVEGDIRFGDVPERDLEGFLRLCKELDLFVICRPGPYQYSELRYDGLPGWLCHDYPELLARDVHGNIYRESSVSYLHPLFLEKVKKWFDAVCPIIAGYTVEKGGPVAFSQIDNEMMGIHIWFCGGEDYNTESMGIGRKGGRYPNFLEKRYRDIDNLNIAYETDYRDFLDVKPFNGKTPVTTAERRMAKDYQDFYYDTIGEYGEILVNWMRESGIDCTIIHNSPNPASNASFLETVKRLGKNFLLGSDHYYTLTQDWEQNNPTPQYASKIFYSNEMLRLMGYPPTIMELPGGSCSDWPPVLPEDLKCCYYTNIAFGMKGFNYYIFTGGANPFNSGALGDIYDYGAGIGADGSIRPIYDVQKEFGLFLKDNPWLAQTEAVGDFYIGLDWEHSRSYRYFSDPGEFNFSNVQAWEFLRKGIMMSALCSSYIPKFADLYSDDIYKCMDKPLTVATSTVMPEDVQQRIINYVKKGGKVLLVPVIPYLDEKFDSCTLLIDFLEGARIERCLQAFPRVNIGSIENILVNGILFKSSRKPAGARQIGIEEYSSGEVGWIKDYPGGGKVMWLGLQWNHSMFSHGRLMDYILKRLGLKSRTVICDNPNVWVTAWKATVKNEQRVMVFAMNLFASPLKATIRIKNNDGNYYSPIELNLAPMEVKKIRL